MHRRDELRRLAVQRVGDALGLILEDVVHAVEHRIGIAKAAMRDLEGR